MNKLRVSVKRTAGIWDPAVIEISANIEQSIVDLIKATTSIDIEFFKAEKTVFASDGLEMTRYKLDITDEQVQELSRFLERFGRAFQLALPHNQN